MKLLSDLIDNVLNAKGGLAGINPGARTELDVAVAKYRSGMRRRPSAEEIGARIERGVASVWGACAMCESPIEKLIVPWLVFQDYQLTDEYEPVALSPADEPINADILLIPQFKLDRSRFDFMLVARLKGAAVMLAIECDGRAFHNSDADFYRDKAWRQAGIGTVRLTGGAIHESPERAALKVAQALQEQAHREGLI
jgi:very-short-patch-repair endonuclease